MPARVGIKKKDSYWIIMGGCCWDDNTKLLKNRIWLGRTQKWKETTAWHQRARFGHITCFPKSTSNKQLKANEEGEGRENLLIKTGQGTVFSHLCTMPRAENDDKLWLLMLPSWQPFDPRAGLLDETRYFQVCYYRRINFFHFHKFSSAKKAPDNLKYCHRLDFLLLALSLVGLC